MNYKKTLKYSCVAVAMCTSAIVFSACSDSGSSSSAGDGLISSVKIDGEDVGDTLVLDMMDSVYEIAFEAGGSWKLLDKTMFIQKLGKTSGEGNATVDFRVAVNDLDEPLSGELIIENLDDTTQNKTITVVQKYFGDYPDNASTLKKSNKIYAVGYGYDALTGGYADYGSLKAEIFDTKTLIDDEVITESPTSVKVNVHKWSDEGYYEYELWLDKWAVGAIDVDMDQTTGFDVGWFYGELESSFGYLEYGDEAWELAATYVNVAIKTVDIEESELDDVVADGMKKSAYNAINGLDAKFPSDNAGFKKLIERYGTHVVLGSTLGGRIRQTMMSTRAYEFALADYAKAAYQNVFGIVDEVLVDDAEAVDAEVYESYEEYYEELNVNVTVFGGDADKAMKISDSKMLNAKDVNDWKASLTKDENATLVDFSGNRLMPLYELIDESLGEDAVARKAKLKAYMESSDILTDFGVKVPTKTEK